MSVSLGTEATLAQSCYITVARWLTFVWRCYTAIIIIMMMMMMRQFIRWS